MAARRPSAADAEIARLTAADEAANVAYTAALGRAYSLDLPDSEEEAAFATLRAAGVRCRETYVALLAAIDARREGMLHATSIAPTGVLAITLQSEVGRNAREHGTARGDARHGDSA